MESRILAVQGLYRALILGQDRCHCLFQGGCRVEGNWYVSPGWHSKKEGPRPHQMEESMESQRSIKFCKEDREDEGGVSRHQAAAGEEKNKRYIQAEAKRPSPRERFALKLEIKGGLPKQGNSSNTRNKGVEIADPD